MCAHTKEERVEGKVREKSEGRWEESEIEGKRDRWIEEEKRGEAWDGAGVVLTCSLSSPELHISVGFRILCQFHLNPSPLNVPSAKELGWEQGFLCMSAS